jgi:hypothetical protein
VSTSKQIGSQRRDLDIFCSTFHGIYFKMSHGDYLNMSHDNYFQYMPQQTGLLLFLSLLFNPVMHLLIHHTSSSILPPCCLDIQQQPLG